MPKKLIKNHYTEIFLKAAGKPFNLKEVNRHKEIWWWNNRSKDKGGLRLTDTALKFIEQEAEIKTYPIEFPKDFVFTPQILVWLDHFIDTPYYIDKKQIIVLQEKTAFEIYLFSGDVAKLGYNKAMSKRLNQNTV
jgi:hypothetical protein